MNTHRYPHRRAAGRELARVLWAFARREPVVVALDHGGVPVAFEVALALHAPLATDSSAYDVGGRTVIVVHDGLATERVLRKTLRSLRRRGARQLVLATPVGETACLARLSADADEIVCTRATGEREKPSDWYDDDEPTTAADVIDLVTRARTLFTSRAEARSRALGRTPNSQPR